MRNFRPAHYQGSFEEMYVCIYVYIRLYTVMCIDRTVYTRILCRNICIYAYMNVYIDRTVYTYEHAYIGIPM